MRKISVIFMLCLLFVGQTVFGALPPLHQEVKEIKAILDSAELREFFASSDMIEEIRMQEHFYYIYGEFSACQVEVIYLPSALIGPAQFKLIFSECT